MHGRRRLQVIGVLAGLAFGLVAGGGHAATVQVLSGTTIDIIAGAGEVNNISVTPPLSGNVYTVMDLGTVPTAGGGCAPVASHTLQCTVASLSSVYAQLGDESDVMTIAEMPSDVGSTIYGENGLDSITGGPGSDTIDGGNGSDGIFGGAGSDDLSGGGDNDNVTVGGLLGVDGGAGGDVLRGSAGADRLVGGADTDIADYSGSSSVTINLATGTATDTVTDVLLTIEDAVGTAGADTITGTSGPNFLNGIQGNDTLQGLGGADTLEGSADTDTVTYLGEPAVTATASSGTTSEGTDTFTTIEKVIGSSFADTMTGDAGVNHFVGGAGNDLLEGGTGADTLDGGDDTDTITYVNSATRVVVDLVNNTANEVDASTTDSVPNVENVIGSNNSTLDHITGDTGANRIQGMDGGDSLFGGGGSDVLDGGAGGDLMNGDAGNDTLTGGGGNDQLNGGDDSDTLDYSSAAAAVTAILPGGSSNDGDGSSDSGSGNENVIGSAGNDVIFGDGNANVISAGAGESDFILSNGGDDTLDGGAGGNDVVSFQGSPAVTASLLAGTATGPGNSTLAGFERLNGSNNADTLTGDTSANQINGLAGDDVLHGRGGADFLFGSTGNDTASYAAAAGPVTANLAEDAATADGDGATDTFNLIENLTGSTFADDLTSSSVVNVLQGLAGADVLRSRDSGPDTVDCGADSDRAITDGSEISVTACETNDDPSPTATPAITGSTPASGANDNSPRMAGTAPAGSTVSLHTARDCSSAAVASGPAADFASPGFLVTVLDNSTTTVYAKATSTDVDGPSGCSPAFTYVESTPAAPVMTDPGPAGPVGPVVIADIIAPETTITNPKKNTTDRTPTFRFRSSEAGSTFECRVDRGKFAGCKSPKTLKRLKLGRHTFIVRARDAAGNADATPARDPFTVKRKPRKRS